MAGKLGRLFTMYACRYSLTEAYPFLMSRSQLYHRRMAKFVFITEADGYRRRNIFFGDGMKSIILAIVDFISLGLLFWLVPTVIAKLVKRKMAGIPRPYLQEMLKQLPGVVTGAFIAVAAFYLFGMSYEEFAANTARQVGNRAMTYLSIDETSRCKVRLTEKYKLLPAPTINEAAEMNMPITMSERDRLMSEIGVSLLIGRNRTPEQHIDIGLTSFCNRYGLNYPNVRSE